MAGSFRKVSEVEGVNLLTDALIWQPLDGEADRVDSERLRGGARQKNFAQCDATIFR